MQQTGRDGSRLSPQRQSFDQRASDEPKTVGPPPMVENFQSTQVDHQAAVESVPACDDYTQINTQNYPPSHIQQSLGNNNGPQRRNPFERNLTKPVQPYSTTVGTSNSFTFPAQIQRGSIGAETQNTPFWTKDSAHNNQSSSLQEVDPHQIGALNQNSIQTSGSKMQLTFGERNSHSSQGVQSFGLPPPVIPDYTTTALRKKPLILNQKGKKPDSPYPMEAVTISGQTQIKEIPSNLASPQEWINKNLAVINQEKSKNNYKSDSEDSKKSNFEEEEFAQEQIVRPIQTANEKIDNIVNFPISNSQIPSQTDITEEAGCQNYENEISQDEQFIHIAFENQNNNFRKQNRTRSLYMDLEEQKGQQQMENSELIRIGSRESNQIRDPILLQGRQAFPDNNNLERSEQCFQPNSVEPVVQSARNTMGGVHQQHYQSSQTLTKEIKQGGQAAYHLQSSHFGNQTSAAEQTQTDFFQDKDQQQMSLEQIGYVGGTTEHQSSIVQTEILSRVPVQDDDQAFCIERSSTQQIDMFEADSNSDAFATSSQKQNLTQRQQSEDQQLAMEMSIQQQFTGSREGLEIIDSDKDIQNESEQQQNQSLILKTQQKNQDSSSGVFSKQDSSSQVPYNCSEDQGPNKESDCSKQSSNQAETLGLIKKEKSYVNQSSSRVKSEQDEFIFSSQTGQQSQKIEKSDKQNESQQESGSQFDTAPVGNVKTGHARFKSELEARLDRPNRRILQDYGSVEAVENFTTVTRGEQKVETCFEHGPITTQTNSLPQTSALIGSDAPAESSQWLIQYEKEGNQNQPQLLDQQSSDRQHTDPQRVQQEHISVQNENEQEEEGSHQSLLDKEMIGDFGGDIDHDLDESRLKMQSYSRKNSQQLQQNNRQENDVSDQSSQRTNRQYFPANQISNDNISVENLQQNIVVSQIEETSPRDKEPDFTLGVTSCLKNDQHLQTAEDRPNLLFGNFEQIRASNRSQAPEVINQFQGTKKRAAMYNRQGKSGSRAREQKSQSPRRTKRMIIRNGKFVTQLDERAGLGNSHEFPIRKSNFNPKKVKRMVLNDKLIQKSVEVVARQQQQLINFSQGLSARLMLQSSEECLDETEEQGEQNQFQNRENLDQVNTLGIESQEFEAQNQIELHPLKNQASPFKSSALLVEQQAVRREEHQNLSASEVRRSLSKFGVQSNRGMLRGNQRVTLSNLLTNGNKSSMQKKQSKVTKRGQTAIQTQTASQYSRGQKNQSTFEFARHQNNQSHLTSFENKGSALIQQPLKVSKQIHQNQSDFFKLKNAQSLLTGPSQNIQQNPSNYRPAFKNQTSCHKSTSLLNRSSLAANINVKYTGRPGNFSMLSTQSQGLSREDLINLQKRKDLQRIYMERQIKNMMKKMEKKGTGKNPQLFSSRRQSTIRTGSNLDRVVIGDRQFQETNLATRDQSEEKLSNNGEVFARKSTGNQRIIFGKNTGNNMNSVRCVGKKSRKMVTNLTQSLQSSRKSAGKLLDIYIDRNKRRLDVVDEAMRIGQEGGTGVRFRNSKEVLESVRSTFDGWVRQGSLGSQSNEMSIDQEQDIDHRIDSHQMTEADQFTGGTPNDFDQMILNHTRSEPDNIDLAQQSNYNPQIQTDQNNFGAESMLSGVQTDTNFRVKKSNKIRVQKLLQNIKIGENLENRQSRLANFANTKIPAYLMPSQIPMNEALVRNLEKHYIEPNIESHQDLSQTPNPPILIQNEESIRKSVRKSSQTSSPNLRNDPVSMRLHEKLIQQLQKQQGKDQRAKFLYHNYWVTLKKDRHRNMSKKRQSNLNSNRKSHSPIHQKRSSSIESLGKSQPLVNVNPNSVLHTQKASRSSQRAVMRQNLLSRKQGNRGTEMKTKLELISLQEEQQQSQEYKMNNKKFLKSKIQTSNLVSMNKQDERQQEIRTQSRTSAMKNLMNQTVPPKTSKQSEIGSFQVFASSTDNQTDRVEIEKKMTPDYVLEQDVVESEVSANYEIPHVLAENDAPLRSPPKDQEALGEQLIIGDRSDEEINDVTISKGIPQIISQEPMQRNSEMDGEGQFQQNDPAGEEYYAEEKFFFEDEDQDVASSQDPESKFIKELRQKNEENFVQSPKIILTKNTSINQRNLTQQNQLIDSNTSQTQLQQARQESDLMLEFNQDLKICQDSLNIPLDPQLLVASAPTINEHERTRQKDLLGQESTKKDRLADQQGVDDETSSHQRKMDSHQDLVDQYSDDDYEF